MNLLYQQAFANALGWSLIDSLWQMGAIWFFYIMITNNGRKFSSQVRHSIALTGSAAGTCLFFLSLALNYYSAVNHSNFFSLAYLIEKEAGEIIDGYTSADKFIPLISCLYIPAVVFFFFRLLFNVNINRNIYRKNLVSADGKIARFVHEMSERSGIMKNITVWLSEKVESPLTIGFWKPVIILPVAVFSHLTCAQVEAVIMHELHHIKRNDYIINIFLTVAELILFFNPFARMMFGNVKKERENSCDDFVIASGFDAWEYSQALYILGRYRVEKNNLAIAATGEGKEYLLQRIRRIMKKNNPSPSVLKPAFAFFLCLFVAGFAIRYKQIAAVPYTGNITVPVENTASPTYYFEEKRITITRPDQINRPQRTKGQKVSATAKKNSNALLKADKIKGFLPQETITSPEVSDEETRFSFVAAPQVLEFTIIDPAKPVIPNIICESPQPYIQKSSFYFTEIDTTAGKKVIEL